MQAAVKPLDLIAQLHHTDSWGRGELWMVGAEYPRDTPVRHPFGELVRVAIKVGKFTLHHDTDWPLRWIENPVQFCAEHELGSMFEDAFVEARRLRKMSNDMVAFENSWLYW